MRQFEWQCSRCGKRCRWPCEPAELAADERARAQGLKTTCHECVRRLDLVTRIVSTDAGLQVSPGPAS